MKSTIMAVLFIVAASAYGAVGDYDLFIPSRDWGNLQGDGDLANSGGNQCHRIYKGDWQEGYVMDWDASVGEASGQSMLDWMAANVPAEGQRYKFTLDLSMVGYGDWMVSNPVNVDDPLRLEIRTLNLGNGTDWAEGDGSFSGCAGDTTSLNWTPDTAAACN